MTEILVIAHVLISLLAIGAGLVVANGMLRSDRMDKLTDFFLITTVLTTLSGVILPADKLMPSHVVGILSLIALAIAAFGRYQRNYAGGWRATYVGTALTAQYLNMFVLVVQLFQKIPALKALAPTQAEPPFAIVQGALLVAVVVVGVLATKRFRPAVLSAR